MYADRSLNEIGAELNFSQKNLFSETYNKLFVEQKINLKIVLHTFQNIAHLLGPKTIGPLLRKSKCRSLGNNQHTVCAANILRIKN